MAGDGVINVPAYDLGCDPTTSARCPGRSGPHVVFTSQLSITPDMRRVTLPSFEISAKTLYLHQLTFNLLAQSVCLCV